MEIFDGIIRQIQDVIDDLQQKLDSEKIILEESKAKQKELFDNYTNATLDIDELDEEFMNLEDIISACETKIKGLERRILHRKRSLLIYKFNTGDI